MNEGYIKLFRQMTAWEWYLDTNVKCLFIHCLLKANWEDKKFKGKVIPRGSFLTSYDKLSKELKLSEKQMRVALKKLNRTNEVASEKMLNGTLITVLNYESYQSEGKQEGTQRADEGQTEGRRRAKNKLNKASEVASHKMLNSTLKTVLNYECYQSDGKQEGTQRANEWHTNGKKRATTKELKKEVKELKEVKNKYGFYKHVLLTSTEYNSLQVEYGNVDELITYLDEYIEMTGKKYKSHYLAVRKWVVEAVKERNIKKQSKKIDVLPDYYADAKNGEVDNLDEKVTLEEINALQENLKSLGG